MQGYLAPPIFVVFFFGVFIKRLNSKGCLAALLVGFALGAFRLAVDTPVSLRLEGFAQGYQPGSFLWVVNNIYFQYYSLLIFAVSLVVMILVSYLSPPPAESTIQGLTYGTVSPMERESTRQSWNRHDVVSSLIVLALIFLAYVYFSG